MRKQPSTDEVPGPTCVLTVRRLKRHHESVFRESCIRPAERSGDGTGAEARCAGPARAGSPDHSPPRWTGCGCRERRSRWARNRYCWHCLIDWKLLNFSGLLGGFLRTKPEPAAMRGACEALLALCEKDRAKRLTLTAFLDHPVMTGSPLIQLLGSSRKLREQCFQYYPARSARIAGATAGDSGRSPEQPQ